MHVGGHLRDAFLWTVEDREGDVWELSPDTLVEGDHRDQDLTWGRLLGLLWNCTDIVPVDCCQDLDFPQAFTYAQVVRSIKPMVTS